MSLFFFKLHFFFFFWWELSVDESQVVIFRIPVTESTGFLNI